MKLTPLLLFLLLVVILVISVIVCKNCWNLDKQEGFVNFAADSTPIDVVTIPQYTSSRGVIKLYDNLFFDKVNANIIEVDSTTYTGNIRIGPIGSKPTPDGNVDITGNTIANVYVSTRANVMKTYPVTSTAASESNISTISSSYNAFDYITKCAKTDTYQLFYIPWDTKTLVTVITKHNTYREGSDISTKNFMFGNTADCPIQYMPSIAQVSDLTATAADNDPKNNTYVTDEYYDSAKKVYQLSKYVKFDPTNAYLLIRGEKSLDVRTRYPGPILTYNQVGQVSNTPSTIVNTNYITFTFNDKYQNIVSYTMWDKNTVIALYQKDGVKYKMVNVARFTEAGLDTGTKNATPTSTGAATASAAGTDASGNIMPPLPPDVSGNAISDYYKWYWYWNSAAGGASTNKYSDDYILKTQIVPPVCPSCPNCPSNTSGTCTSCGGQGGSGTLTADGSSLVKDDKGVKKDDQKQQPDQSSTYDNAKGVVNNTVDATGRVLYRTANATGRVLSGAANATGNIVTGTVDAATGVVNNVVDEVGGVAKALINAPQNGGYYGNGGGAGAGSYGNGGGAGSYGTGAPGFSQGNAPIDNYSYYGALPEKGADYMPVTTDFSAFRK